MGRFKSCTDSLVRMLIEDFLERVGREQAVNEQQSVRQEAESLQTQCRANDWSDVTIVQDIHFVICIGGRHPINKLVYKHN